VGLCWCVGCVIFDSTARLNLLPPLLPTPQQVAFVNASGLSEAGLDHGGLTKELLEQAVSAAMDPG